MICSKFSELRDMPASTNFPLLSKWKITEEIARIKSNCNRFGIFGLSSNEKDTAETKRKRIYGTFLIDLGVIKMPSHVVFFWVVVYYCWFGDILSVLMDESVVKLVCPQREIRNRGWKVGFHVWVFSIGPVVLISHICPPYLIIEVITIAFLFIFFFLFFHLLLFFYLFSFFNFLLIQFLRTIQISSIGFATILIKSVSCYIIHHIFTIEISNNKGTHGIGKRCNLISKNIHIFFGLENNTEISFLVLVEFKVFFHCFKRI